MLNCHMAVRSVCAGLCVFAVTLICCTPIASCCCWACWDRARSRHSQVLTDYRRIATRTRSSPPCPSIGPRCNRPCWGDLGFGAKTPGFALVLTRGSQPKRQQLATVTCKGMPLPPKRLMASLLKLSASLIPQPIGQCLPG